MANLRTQFLLVFLTLVAPFGGVMFGTAPRLVDAHAFEAPPIDTYVEFHVDRVQATKWTIRTNGELTGRFALGWIGDRAVLLETELQLPAAGTLRGEVRPLTGEPRAWIDQSPKLRAVLYDTVVELQDPGERLWTSLGCWAVFAAMLVYWFVRWWRWRHPKPVQVAPPPVWREPDRGLAVAPPRSDAAVSSLVRRCGPRVVLGWTLLYVVAVMSWFGMATAALLGFDLLDASAPRLVGEIILGTVVSAPITGLPIARWIRRRLGDLRTVARLGDLLAPQTASATMQGMFADVTIGVTFDGIGAVYKFIAGGPPDWLKLGQFQLIASREHRYAIVLAGNGKTYVATRTGHDSHRRRRQSQLPTARVIAQD